MKRSLTLVFGALAVFAAFLPFRTKSLSAVAAEPVSSLALVEAKTFLDQYRSASHAQSPQFYDLYSDRAVVHAHIQGQDKGVAFQGRAYKQWGRTLLQSGRAALDGSVFRDATVEQRGDRMVIHAKRYSTTRCYWDPTYLVGIEKEGAAYRIVEERLGTNPGARCGASDAASLAAAPAAASIPGGSGYLGLPTSNVSMSPGASASAVTAAGNRRYRYADGARDCRTISIAEELSSECGSSGVRFHQSTRCASSGSDPERRAA
jgi:hypothetical protein